MASILIVDDEEAIRDMLSDLLSAEHVCCSVGSAEEALLLLATTSYDLLLTDISLPGLSGLELLGRVHQTYGSTRVIVISGISDEDHALGLIRLGAFDYLLKPFRLEMVEDSVQRALATDVETARSVEAVSAEEAIANDWRIVRKGSAGR